MSEYKRLTDEKEHYKKCVGCSYRNCQYCEDKYEYAREVHKRLAELEDKIEQGKLKEEKTCKNISEMHPVDGFTCSECGITLIDYVEQRVDQEEYDITHHEYEMKYCPNCGAKVVET